MATPETKPSPQAYSWAESAASPADISATGGTIQNGWASGATPPSRQRFNWILNQCHRAIRYLFNKGIVEYDGGETYPVNAFVEYSGEIYKCIQANTPAAAKAPTDAAYWTPLANRVDAAALVTTQTAGATIGTPVLTTINGKKKLTFQASGTGGQGGVSSIAVDLSGVADFSPTHLIWSTYLSGGFDAAVAVQVVPSAHALTITLVGVGAVAFTVSVESSIP